MRASARGDDRGKESGDRKRKGEDSKGVNEERIDENNHQSSIIFLSEKISSLIVDDRLK